MKRQDEKQMRSLYQQWLFALAGGTLTCGSSAWIVKSQEGPSGPGSWPRLFRERTGASPATGMVIKYMDYSYLK